MKWITLFLLLFFAGFAPGVAGAAPSGINAERFPVDAVLSAPFPQEITAAPVGQRVAFVLNEQGRRNIWLADGPDFAARRLTAYTQDDGIDVSTLRFTPDAQQLVFVRGGAPNSAGELPNPASLPQGTELAIYVIDTHGDTAGGSPARKLADGAAPVIHPDGQSVAYTKQGAVWSQSLLAPDSEPRKLFGARGGISDLTWSADGSRLLFTSDRGSHSFVGLWTAPVDDNESTGPSGSITWLAPSYDRDISPVWSPDGRQVAFIRLPTRDLDQFIFAPVREDLPWSIWVADVQSGKARELWQADAGMGSVLQFMVAQKQLFWRKGRLVFAWEKTGWNHLWSIADSGGADASGQAKELTPGEFEVEHVSLSADGGSLIYSSNQDDLHRRHLWEVNIGGGRAKAPKLLTPGAGIEWAPAPLPGGSVALLRSDALRPARAAVLDTRGKLRDLAPETVPAEFPEGLVVPEAVTITATDGLPIPGQLFLPSDLKPGERRPAVIFLHGGSRRQMLLGWHKSGYYHHAYGLSQYLASRGVIALALNYRSGIGYGMKFREAEEYGAKGASEFRDVLGAGLYLQNRPDVRPDKVGLWGGSYGGYLTAHALAQASDLFVAGVDLHGVHDWNDGIRNFIPYYNPNDYPEAGRLADESSPLHFINDWRSPVLIIHGDDDRNVHFNQSTRLVRALRKQGVLVEQLVFPDEVHGFLRHQSWQAAYQATADFLLRNLDD